AEGNHDPYATGGVRVDASIEIGEQRGHASGRGGRYVGGDPDDERRQVGGRTRQLRQQRRLAVEALIEGDASKRGASRGRRLSRTGESRGARESEQHRQARDAGPPDDHVTMGCCSPSTSPIGANWAPRSTI